MVRAYAAIGRRRHGPVCCRRANGALRFVLTIDYGPSLPPSEIITRGLIDPILTRWGASERLPRAENPCAVRLQLIVRFGALTDRTLTWQETTKLVGKVNRTLHG